MTSCNVRPYALADGPSLIATINTVCAEGQWMETLQYEPTPAWEHALTAPDCPCHLLLAAVDSRVIGWCRVFRDAGSQTSADIAIGLLAEYREQGWGNQLFEQAITWAYDNGLTRLHLKTRANNTRAIHLFDKFGFIFVRSLDETWMEMEKSTV